MYVGIIVGFIYHKSQPYSSGDQLGLRWSIKVFRVIRINSQKGFYLISSILSTQFSLSNKMGRLFMNGNLFHSSNDFVYLPIETHNAGSFYFNLLLNIGVFTIHKSIKRCL